MLCKQDRWPLQFQAPHLVTFDPHVDEGRGTGDPLLPHFLQVYGCVGLGDPFLQPQSWSCGASVCFLGNRERKPPFKRAGRPQQPRTQRHTDSQAAAHTQAPASALAVSTARLRPGAGAGGRNNLVGARVTLQPQLICRSTWLHPCLRCPAPSHSYLPSPALTRWGGAIAGGWRGERKMSLPNSSLRPSLVCTVAVLCIVVCIVTVLET